MEKNNTSLTDLCGTYQCPDERKIKITPTTEKGMFNVHFYDHGRNQYIEPPARFPMSTIEHIEIVIGKTYTKIEAYTPPKEHHPDKLF